MVKRYSPKLKFQMALEVLRDSKKPSQVAKAAWGATRPSPSSCSQPNGRSETAIWSARRRSTGSSRASWANLSLENDLS